MKKLRPLSLLLFLLLPGCDREVSGGTSTETENSATARVIRVDSVLDSSERRQCNPAVATLRFDGSNFDFSRSTDSGLDLAVVGMDSSPVPFEVPFWDSASGQGRIHVRIAKDFLLPGARFMLRWGLARERRSDSAAVWADVSAIQKLASTSVLVDDFEGGGILHNRLPDSSFWYVNGSVPASGLASADSGRGGNALHLVCSAGQCDTGRVLLAATLLAGSPRCVRSMDSIVFWARGSGRVRLSLEHLDSSQIQLVYQGRLGELNPSRTWTSRTLNAGWNRIALRPTDFDAADGLSGNVGWGAVRDSINYLTFLIEGGSEMWLDDIRFHGIVRGDLR